MDANAALASGGSLASIGASGDASILPWLETKNPAGDHKWKAQNEVYDRCGRLPGFCQNLYNVTGAQNRDELSSLVEVQMETARKAIEACYEGPVNDAAGGDPRKPLSTMDLFDRACTEALGLINSYPPDQKVVDANVQKMMTNATYVTRAARAHASAVAAARARRHLSQPGDQRQGSGLPTVGDARHTLVDVWRVPRPARRRGASKQTLSPGATQCPLEGGTMRHPRLLAKNALADLGMGSRLRPDTNATPEFPGESSWLQPVAANAGALPEYVMQERWVVRGNGVFPQKKADTWTELMAQIRGRLQQLLLLMGDQTATSKAGAQYQIRLLADDEVEAIIAVLSPELLGWSHSPDLVGFEPTPDGAGVSSWWDSILRWAEGGWDGTHAELAAGPLRKALAEVNGQLHPAAPLDAVEYGQPRVLQRAMEAARGLPPPTVADPQGAFPYRLMETPEEVWNAKQFNYKQLPDKHRPDVAPAIFFASSRGYAWALTTTNELSTLKADDKAKYDFEHRFHRKIDGPG